MISLDNIKKIEKIENYCNIMYMVTLKNDIIINVPNDEMNRDHKIVMEWFKQNEGEN